MGRYRLSVYEFAAVLLEYNFEIIHRLLNFHGLSIRLAWPFWTHGFHQRHP